VTRLFNRICAVQIEDKAFTDLRVTFNVLRTLRSSPAQAEIVVYNLEPNLRKSVVELAQRKVTASGDVGRPGRVRVRLLAGYETTGAAQIFSGDLREVRIERQGPDVALRMSAGDGLSSLSTRGAPRSFAAGTPLIDVLKRVVQDSGLDEGNAVTAARTALQGKTLGAGGLVLDGDGARGLDAVTRAGGLEWSIQDGQVQVLGKDRGLSAVAVKLSGETGLIGSPQEDQRRHVKCVSLMNPDIVPGRVIRLESLDITGDYRAQDVRYIGDTDGQPWYCEIEARRLQ
jgi:hypothetical protein